MTAEALAERILNAAGTSLKNYTPQSKERIIGAARVQPLVWKESLYTSIGCAWVDNFGLYQITGDFTLFIGHETIGVEFDTIEAARLAAQSDYEASVYRAILGDNQ